MAKQVVGETREMTSEEARAFLIQTEVARLERNRKLREWRADPANGYKQYYADWLEKRAAKIRAAVAIVKADMAKAEVK